MKFIIAAMLFTISFSCAASDNVVPNKLVQLIIDSESLSPYWHSEVAGRVPLKILHRHIGSFEGIRKHGRNIVLVKEPDNHPYFEITGFSISNGEWFVTVAYPIEGVSGLFKAKMLPNRQWKILSASIVEN